MGTSLETEDNRPHGRPGEDANMILGYKINGMRERELKLVCSEHRQVECCEHDNEPSGSTTMRRSS